MGLRIAVLSRNFASTGGGAERYSVALVEQLALAHEVHVFAQNIEHNFPGVVYHRISVPMHRPRWINQLYFAFATWRVTRRGFDIVHSHENTWHGNVQTVHVLPIKHTLFAGKTGFQLAMRWLKVVTSPRLITYLWLEKKRYALGGKRVIVVTSNSLKKVLLNAYPHVQSAIKVIAPGISTAPGLCGPEVQRAARSLLGLPESGRGLLFVGNDFRRKGLPSLLDAMVHWPEGTWLAVVGQSTPTQLEAVQQRVGALGISGRVWFLGALSNMDDAYHAADCLVHPTLEDTYAMVVLEAMSHGLPVVVSGPRYCGISADLTKSVQALILDDPNSVPELAAAVGSVLGDPYLYATLSANAVAFAQTRTWLRAATAYEALYPLASAYKQRWLVLSHAFNMDGRAASQTITDKLPYFEKAGIELVVLSGVSGRHDAHYEHCQLWPAGPAGIRFEMRHVLQKHFGKGVLYRSVMVVLSLPLLPFMVVEKLLWPMESSWSWWLSAYLKGLWLARTGNFDLIYSTGGAFAAHVAGMHLKRALGIPWMAEVHDPLVTPGREGASDLTSQERMQAKVEQQICAEADVAIWFTDQALASALRRNPQLGVRGKMMIPGVDKSSVDLTPYQRTDRFVIGHFGSLSPTRNLTHVIHVLEWLLENRPDDATCIELHLYGGPLDSVSARVIATSPAKRCVKHFGRLETDPISGKSGREQILQYMRNVDVLLLLHGDEPICAEYIPSKLYEYLWMQRPIVATVHQNPQMAALISKLGHTTVVTTNDDEASGVYGMKKALTALFDRWLIHDLSDNGIISPCTTQAAVMQLLTWTNQISEGRN